MPWKRVAMGASRASVTYVGVKGLGNLSWCPIYPLPKEAGSDCVFELRLQAEKSDSPEPLVGCPDLDKAFGCGEEGSENDGSTVILFPKGGGICLCPTPPENAGCRHVYGLPDFTYDSLSDMWESVGQMAVDRAMEVSNADVPTEEERFSVWHPKDRARHTALAAMPRKLVDAIQRLDFSVALSAAPEGNLFLRVFLRKELEDPQHLLRYVAQELGKAAAQNAS